MKKTILIAICGLLAAVHGFSQQQDLQPAATVNIIRNEPITVRQLRTEVTRLETATGRTLTPEERRQVLDTMINERLALQAAERDRVTISEGEVNQRLQQLRNVMAQQLGRQPTDAEFHQAIRTESGMEFTAFRDQLRRQMIVEKYLLSKKEGLISSIRVPTDEEIRNQYNLVKAQLVRPDTVRFSMIQVPYGPDAASRTRAREQAERLVREINSNPSRFDEVAARGQAPNAGFMAGDGGYLPRNQEALNIVGQEFMNAAFSLRQGEVSRLIEGNPGYQIIKITENYAMKNLELEDIFQLGTRVTVRDYIGQMMLQERQQTIITQATQELTTELRAGRNFQIFERNLNW
jgi:parvulin-like peptidyl-prolyl isomerase